MIAYGWANGVEIGHEQRFVIVRLQALDGSTYVARWDPISATWARFDVASGTWVSE